MVYPLFRGRAFLTNNFYLLSQLSSATCFYAYNRALIVSPLGTLSQPYFFYRDNWILIPEITYLFQVKYLIGKSGFSALDFPEINSGAYIPALIIFSIPVKIGVSLFNECIVPGFNYLSFQVQDRNICLKILICLQG